MTAPQYTGELRKGDSPGSVVAEIRDRWGWEIHLTGTLTAPGVYTLTGTLGPVPDALRVPLLDDAK